MNTQQQQARDWFAAEVKKLIKKHGQIVLTSYHPFLDYYDEFAKRRIISKDNCKYQSFDPARRMHQSCFVGNGQNFVDAALQFDSHSTPSTLTYQVETVDGEHLLFFDESLWEDAA